MTVLGVVPARAGSERFPRKHQSLVLGRPLISYTLDAVRQARHIDRAVLSTDDPELEPIARAAGLEVVHRPAELAVNTAALDDAVRHVYRTLKESDGYDPDIVVVMQANLPVRRAGQIDHVVERLRSIPSATAVCTAMATRFRPEWAKVLKDPETGEVGPYMPGAHGYRKQDFPRLFMVDGGVMAVRREVLLSAEGDRAAHAWFGGRLYVVVQEHPKHSLEVDYPDEVPLAEFYLLQESRGERWYTAPG